MPDETASRPPARELATYLPLSQRPRVDESDVTGDWAPRLGVLLARVAELLESTPVWSDDLRRGARAIAVVLAPRGGRREAGEADDAATLARLRDAATTSAAAGASAGRRRRTRIGTLGRVLVEAYALADLTGRTLEVDPTTSAAVALARSLVTPFPQRVVARSRTLVADDAEWRIGAGPELHGTARQHVLFLYGRGPLPGASA